MLSKSNKIFIFIVSCFLFVQSYAIPKLSPGEVGGKAYILIEANTGTTLARYHADERLEPASITKLMTAYVVYNSIKAGIISLEDKTIITPRAREMGGSRMFLERGSHVSIDDLLSGLVIQSGNDAAVALAEAVSGDESRFVELMNKYARALGMTNSQFKNVSGMPEEGHYMSARDIATLSYAIIKNFPKEYKRYSRNSFTWNKITQENRNALLRTNPNVDGLKTGHTKAAGYCLAASSKRGNMRLISVVLGTKSVGARARASKKLLAYGFDNFLNKTIYKPGQEIAKATVSNGDNNIVGVGAAKGITLPLPKEKNPTKGLKAQLVLNSTLQAPLPKGAVIGHFSVQRNGEQIAAVPAVVLSAVEEAGFFTRLWRGIKETVVGWFS